MLVEETYRTDRGRRRRRVVELELDAAPAGLLAPGQGDQRDWQLRERLASMVGQSRFDIWLGSLWLAAVARDGALVLIAPEESRRWVYERFARVIADAARDVGRCARFAETAQARAIELLAEHSSPPSPASTPASRGHRPPGRAVRGRAGDSAAAQPGWVIDAALRCNRSGVFAAHLSRLDSYELPSLKPEKKAEQLLEEAAKLHRQIDRYAYGAPAVRFSEQDVDQARAAGVLVEFENAAPIITDRPLYRELCKQAIKRSTEELREQAAAVEQQRKAAKAAGRTAIDPEAQARRERGRALRALPEQAHGANLDLGWALRNELANVEIDMSVARFFVL